MIQALTGPPWLGSLKYCVARDQQQDVRVQSLWVPGHSGPPGNEGAYNLAHVSCNAGEASLLSALRNSPEGQQRWRISNCRPCFKRKYCSWTLLLNKKATSLSWWHLACKAAVIRLVVFLSSLFPTVQRAHVFLTSPLYIRTTHKHIIAFSAGLI